MYGLYGVQQPLIPRDRRWEVTERIDYRGRVLVPLDEAEVNALTALLEQQDVVAGEVLVSPVAVERDGDMAARHLRHVPGRDGRGIGERLRITRGRCGSLIHFRMTFSFTKPRRF